MAAKKEKIVILIDGSNMYHYAKELQLTKLLQLDYLKFGKYLARGR